MHNQVIRRTAAAGIALALLLGASACSSDGDGDAASDTKAPAAEGAPTTAAGEDACVNQPADPENLSGNSVVLFAADVDDGQTESDITEADTITIAADGSSMTPESFTVAAGKMFGAKMEEGGSIDGLIIGCAGGQTLVPNVAVGFAITEPGTYPVSLDVAGTALGVIVVE